MLFELYVVWSGHGQSKRAYSFQSIRRYQQEYAPTSLIMVFSKVKTR